MSPESLCTEVKRYTSSSTDEFKINAIRLDAEFPHRCRMTRNQRGAVLLVMMLILLVAASYVLASKLNAAAAQSFRQQRNALVLARAKEALIGYAASYPDRKTTIDRDAGPGCLPCPDIDRDGSSEISCTGDQVAMGRLPWRTLDVVDTTDAGGEALWYAVSKNFWSHPKTTPLNSETSGQLSLDARGDVVAVVFAPGSTVNSQARPSDSIADYLENDNGDDPPDSNFVSAAAGEFNDEVITITRAELMAAVERRVLGEFAQAYERYRSNPDQNPFTPATNYPWLTPFSNPKDPDKMFGATATQRQGQCFCDKDGRRFTAGSITLRFLIPPADGSVTPDPPPINALCFRNDTCTDKGCTFTAPALSGTCDWTNRNRVKCQLAGSTTCGALVRSYAIAMDYTASPPLGTGTVNVHEETPSQVRTRDVTRTQPEPEPVNVTITLTDSDGDSATLSLSGSTTATITTSGIPYGLDIHSYPTIGDPGPDLAELPQWVTSNEWHHLSFFAYATGDAPMPGRDSVGGNACSAGNDCLRVDYQGGGSDTGVRALVLSASEKLNGQNRSAAATDGTLSDYLDLGNQTPADSVYQQQARAPDFNDRVRVICRQTPCP